MEDNSIGTEDKFWIDRTDDPLFIDTAWLDTIVVVGLTCFIVCLMKLSTVSTSKMGMIFGMVGMAVLVAGYWADEASTEGRIVHSARREKEPMQQRRLYQSSSFRWRVC